MTCRLDIIPPPGETSRVVVERERRVWGEADFKKGHIERYCLRKASMMSEIVFCAVDQLQWLYQIDCHHKEEKAILI